MGILDRVSRIVRSNLNDALARAEDPEKLLDQHILDMEDSVREARRRVTDVIAQEKQLRLSLDAKETDATRWYSRAEQALGAGDEELARRALGTRLGLQRDAEELKRQVGVQGEYTSTLKVSLKALEAKLAEAKTRRREIAVEQARREVERARRRAAAPEPRPVDSAPLDDTSAFDAFDRMRDDVEFEDLEAQAMRELDSALYGDAEDAELERRFEELSRSRQTEDDLAALKRKLDGDG